MQVKENTKKDIKQDKKNQIDNNIENNKIVDENQKTTDNKSNNKVVNSIDTKMQNEKTTTLVEESTNVIQNTTSENLVKVNNVNELTYEKKPINILTLFIIFFAIFIAIIIIGFLTFSFYNSKNKNIFSGIYIKNINISELTKEDAKSKVNEIFKNNLPEELILKHGDYETSISTADLNINFDIDSAIDVAYGFGRTSNFFSNNFNVLSTIFFNKHIEPNFSLDESALKDILKDISSKLPDKVIESGYYIDNNNLILNKGSEGSVIDIDEMSNYIKKQIKNLNIINNKLEIITKNKKPSKLDINSIYNEIHKDPVDATFTKDPLSVTPSENGMDFQVSLDEAKSMLDESNSECVIPLKIVYPNVTTNMIGTEAFPDMLSEFSTRYPASNRNRTTNLILAANKINGTVLMPGEVFSYNKVVGERSISAGYKEAAIYVSGRVEDGLGGGICQITTTLYNAVVYANLEIVERSNHQFVPSYAGAGRDATVVYGAIDFKFKNNRNYPIKIMCSVSNGIAYFQILGLRTDNDCQVEIYSRITSQTANNINSETYKIIKQNGNVIDQTLLSRDTYKRH